jgi:DNA-directed RNA polymerase II subunit RPB2
LSNKWFHYTKFPEWVWYLTSDLKILMVDLIVSKIGNSLKIFFDYVDDFQTLCMQTGYYCIHKGKGEIEIKKGLSKGICKESGSVEDIKVYCCTVEPTHLLYVRRNGKPVWCGNSNHGNKCTVGMMYSQKDMPFTSSGITPDMIINPHGFPTRMAMGFIWEAIAYKASVLEGLTIDATAFDDYDTYQLPEVLKSYGFSPYGTEQLYCGFTGKKMDAEIFIAPIYMIRLKHMVADKAHARSRGPRQALTRQPLEGRSRDGGLKVGEMEKDAIVAHGISQFLKERLMESSDIVKLWVCEKCGHFAHKIIDRDYYICKPCKNTTDISPVEMPYAMKVLMEELMTVNIIPTIELSERNFYRHMDVTS